MTNYPPLSPEDKTKIRCALADAFVDTAVDYAYIARQIQGYDIALVEDIFFSEVTAVCHWNAQTPIPPIWTGFDDEWLEAEIEETLRARRESWLKRNIDKLLVVWWRFRFKSFWLEIKNTALD
ncbi:hypothetical protein BLL42_03945 [Pseudomonas frederiksbergensis]|uniref:DUF7079 domain-containing protein n=1 Tax=Pseudomonas frederiksbergensis TaxID=104087 RepID=A0A1J0EFM7_9PSED|nr:hypothetical protein [Pseudomonas frederiksbergensis]APC14909.1 hypothetical protein BLL42_03945 [Pseudomonas frederiksbergensis]